MQIDKPSCHPSSDFSYPLVHDGSTRRRRKYLDTLRPMRSIYLRFPIIYFVNDLTHSLLSRNNLDFINHPPVCAVKLFPIGTWNLSDIWRFLLPFGLFATSNRISIDNFYRWISFLVRVQVRVQFLFLYFLSLW